MMPYGGGPGGNWGHQQAQWNPQDGNKQTPYNNQVMGGNMNNHPNVQGGSQPNPQAYQQNWNYSEQQQNQWQQQWQQQQQYPNNGWVQNSSWQPNNQQWQQNPNQWQQPNMFQGPNNSWGSTPALPVQNPQPPPPPPPPANAQQAPPPPPPEEPSSLPPTDAERDFDLQFKEWEAKYAVWREENKNHPDKKALAEYEAQWNTWREHLLANREQMRKQRAESLNLASQTISAPSAAAPIPAQKPGPPIGNGSEPNLKPPIGPQLPRNSTLTNQPVAYQATISQPDPLQRKVNEQQATALPPYQGGNDNHEQLYSRNHEPLRLHDYPGGFREDPYRPDDRRGNYFPDRNQEAFYDDRGYPDDYHARPYHPSEMEYNRDPGFPGPPRGPLIDREVEHPRMRPHPDTIYREEQLGPPRPLMGPLEPPERFSPVPEGETAASMFRKRALRGKTGGPSRFSAPLAAKVVEPESRPRIEERLAVHAEIKLPPGVIPPAEAKPSAVGPSPVKELTPAIVKDYSNALPIKPAIPDRFEPVIIEYHHQPKRNSQHNSGPVFKDYSHGSKRPKMEPTVHTDGDSVPLIPKREFPTKVLSPEKTVSTFTQLFPSAAAIQEKERNIPQTFPKPEDLVVPDPPRIEAVPIEMEFVMVEDLLLPPGRYGRPAKLVVILRGLPGSGKSHIARLIKEKEVLMGGSAPRILSIDDYYSMDDGSPVPWQSDQEEQYRQNLLKSLKRNLDDGHFPFVIVDALHARSNEVVEVASTARGRAFSVFLVDLPERMSTGTTTRKCSDADIETMKKNWQEAPREIPRLDIGWLLQESARISTPEDIVTSTTALFDDDSQGDSKSNPGVSKWETMEQTEEKLDRLDGIVKKKLEKPASMEDWLQSGLPDDYDYNVDQKPTDGKKRVRWADVEEKMQQKKMRDVGFVVGQTDWRRMTDPTFGDSALTKTKYI